MGAELSQDWGRVVLGSGPTCLRIGAELSQDRGRVVSGAGSSCLRIGAELSQERGRVVSGAGSEFSRDELSVGQVDLKICLKCNSIYNFFITSTDYGALQACNFRLLSKHGSNPVSLVLICEKYTF